MMDEINKQAKDLRDQGHKPTHVIFDVQTYEEFKKNLAVLAKDPEDEAFTPKGGNISLIFTEAGDLDVVVLPGKNDFGFQIGISF